MLKQLLLIGLGGFVGSIARFLVSRLNTRIDWLSIPLGTLTVNVVGSFLIGFLIGISEKSPILTVELRMFLMVGLCGGFTTFSSFTGENLMLMRNGQFLTLFLYTGLSILLGFTAVYLGYISTRLMG
jgi:CrcB protein